MILIFVLCIKLSILHLCLCVSHCDDIHMRRNTIILIASSNHTIHHQLNFKFINKCHEFYDIRIKNNTGNQKDIFERCGTYSNVINLYVDNYNELYKDKEAEEHAIYAGDLTNDETKPKACFAKNSTDLKFFCNETIKLISKQASETNSGDLKDFVEKLDVINGIITSRESCYMVSEKTEALQTVLLCLDYDTHRRDINVNIEPLKLQITTITDCRGVIEKYNYNFLAVLAPKPFQIDFEYTIPVVFYDTPYMIPEHKSFFPNSMTMVPWQLLKYAFLKFMENVGWRRVVIVSDDSVYSTEFENELTTFFNKERVVYTVIRCLKSICDNGELSRELRSLSPRIVIANVEKNYAEYLIDYTNIPDREITWLVRDVAGMRGYRNVFSFSLGSAANRPENTNLVNKVLDGLESVSRAYNDVTHEDLSLSKRQFYRKFGKLMRRTRKPEATAFVHWQSEEILKMHVNISGGTEISFKNPYKSLRGPNDRPPCLAKTSYYFKPCEDELTLLLMFVVILFFTILLLITCYFHKTSPFHDIRYQNFR